MEGDVETRDSNLGLTMAGVLRAQTEHASRKGRMRR